jgi:heme-degrading monooxygenase HmoA
MYGTLMRGRLLPGKEQEIEAFARRESEETRVEGHLGEYVLTSEKNPGEFLVLVLFDSKETYWKNAQSPEQDGRYRQLRALLATDPTWEDGEIREFRPATVPI